MYQIGPEECGTQTIAHLVDEPWLLPNRNGATGTRDPVPTGFSVTGFKKT